MAKDEKKPRIELTKKSSKTAKNTTNRPTKKLRPNPEDNIAKSKKLVEKIQKRKSNVNSTRSFVRSKDDSKVYANGKPMPPLSELERMYEDSDDDNQSKTGSSQIKKSSTICSPRVSTDKLTSHTMIKKIADKMMDLISNLPDTNTTTIIENGDPPPIMQFKKRKKPDATFVAGCKEHSQNLKKSSITCCNGNNKQDSGSDENEYRKAKYPKVVNMLKSGCNAKTDKIPAWLQDYEKADNSDSSNDSNKTVDYDYMKSPSSTGKPQPFSPLPSTSKDRETINKNDQLFNESLISETSMSNNQLKLNIFNDTTMDSNMEIKSNRVEKEKEKLESLNITNTSNMDDVEIIQTPCETIVIDDEFVSNRPITRKCSNKSDIIECIDIVEPMIKKESTKVTGCSEAIVIDDEDDYKFLHDSPTHDEISEVIDIDNIIAENRAIIEKYSNKSDKDINTVTCVDTTTISKLNTVNSVESSNSSVQFTPDTANRIGKHNIVSKNGESANTQINNTNNIQDIVKNYFSNDSHNQNLPEKVSRNATRTNVQNKVAECLDNLTPNYASNKRRTSTSNRTQNADPTNDSVIVIDDMPSPALNTQDAPISARSPPRANSPGERFTRINGVYQSYTNCKDNPKVNLGHMENVEYMNVYRCGEDVYITRHEDPPPGFDSSNLIYKSIPIQEIFNKFATQRESATALSPVKSKSPRSSKNFGDCPICMDSLANNSVASTICGHVFCMKCIEAAFRASGKRCPTCRKVLKKGGYHQIFL